jgi:hypothetical protein
VFLLLISTLSTMDWYNQQHSRLSSPPLIIISGVMAGLLSRLNFLFGLCILDSVIFGFYNCVVCLYMILLIYYYFFLFSKANSIAFKTPCMLFKSLVLTPLDPFYYAFLSSLIRPEPFKPKLLYVIYKIEYSN